MDRNEVYELIDRERAAQDEVWRKGRSNEGQYQFSAPHVLLLEKLVDKLRDEWYTSKYEDFKSRFVKIAAVAVRALEEIKIK